MAIRSRYRTDDNTDLLARIAMLEERLSKLERTNQLSNASVNAGSVLVKGGTITLRSASNEFADGEIRMDSAGYSVDDEVGMSFSVQRASTVDSGSVDFEGNNVGAQSVLFATIDGEQSIRTPTIQLYDKTGAPILGDTRTALQGFSDPSLGYTWWDPNGYKTSTSGTFAAVAQAYWYAYHPHLRITVFTQNDAATTSEVRVVDLTSGNQLALIVGPAASTAGGILTIDRKLLTFGSAFGNGQQDWIEIQHRRASGAGTVRVLVADITGMDLS